MQCPVSGSEQNCQYHYRLGDGMLLLEYWSALYVKDMGVIECIPRKAATMIRGLKHLFCVESLRKLGLFSQKKKAVGRPYCSLSINKGSE